MLEVPKVNDEKNDVLKEAPGSVTQQGTTEQVTHDAAKTSSPPETILSGALELAKSISGYSAKFFISGKDSSSAPSETSLHASSLELVKSIGSFSAILYVFGFLVVRAQNNALGVWSELPLADERYLLAGALFLARTLELLLLPLGFTLLALIAVLSLLLIGVASIGRWVAGSRPELRDKVLDSCRRWIRRLALPSQILVALALTKAVDIASRGAADVAAALVSQGKGHGNAAPWLDWLRHGDKAAEIQYVLLVVLLLATGVCFRGFKGIAPHIPQAPAILRAYMALLLSVELLFLPINYAILVSNHLYPVAVVKAEMPDPRLDGPVFLLLQTDKELVLYGRQGIVSVARDSIKLINVYCYANVYGGLDGITKSGCSEPPREVNGDGLRTGKALGDVDIDGGLSDGGLTDADGGPATGAK